MIADGNALAVRVNGKPCAYKFARNRLHRTGSIALQQYSPKTLIEFRTIDIKELNRPDQKDSKEIRALPRYHRPGDSCGLFAGRTGHPLGRSCHGSHDKTRWRTFLVV